MIGAPVPPQIPRGIQHWHGQATGHFWALLPWPWSPHGARLIEAMTEDDLAGQVQHLMRGMATRSGETSRARAAASSPSNRGPGRSSAVTPPAPTSSHGSQPDATRQRSRRLL